MLFCAEGWGRRASCTQPLVLLQRCNGAFSGCLLHQCCPAQAPSCTPRSFLRKLRCKLVGKVFFWCRVGKVSTPHLAALGSWQRGVKRGGRRVVPADPFPFQGKGFHLPKAIGISTGVCCSAPFPQMVAVNSSSPTPAAAGTWEAQAMGDAGAGGDSSAESLYVQGKRARGEHQRLGVGTARTNTQHEVTQSITSTVWLHLCALQGSSLLSSP